MSENLKRSISNIDKALGELKQFLHEPVINNRDRAGVIKAFEFTFELYWKHFKKLAAEEGIETGGPKSSLKAAFQMSLIENEDEDNWQTMLDDRNLMSHTYQEMLAKDIVSRITNIYLALFVKTRSKLISN